MTCCSDVAGAREGSLVFGEGGDFDAGCGRGCGKNGGGEEEEGREEREGGEHVDLTNYLSDDDKSDGVDTRDGYGEG